MSPTKPKFQEQQRFTQPWIWVLVIVALLALAGVFSLHFYQQLIHGQPNHVGGLSIGAIFGLAVPLLAVAGLWFARLVTTATKEGLLLEFRPFRHQRLISWSQIQSCKARDYRPIREYGGWGMRAGLSGRAYNVSGSRGVQLELVSGERMLIGSQQADKLARVIRLQLDNSNAI